MTKRKPSSTSGDMEGILAELERLRVEVEELRADRDRWMLLWHWASKDALRLSPPTTFKRPGPLPESVPLKGEGMSASDLVISDRDITAESMEPSKGAGEPSELISDDLALRAATKIVAERIRKQFPPRPKEEWEEVQRALEAKWAANPENVTYLSPENLVNFVRDLAAAPRDMMRMEALLNGPHAPDQPLGVTLVTLGARQVLGDRDTAERWLDISLRTLDGRTPREVAADDWRRVMAILIRFEHGVHD